MNEATDTVRLTHAAGLHARPAVKLTKLAKRFAASVSIATSEGGPWVDAKSIVRVMAMKLPRGVTLHVRAGGEDAAAVVDAIVALVRRDFDEGAETSPGDAPRSNQDHAGSA